MSEEKEIKESSTGAVPTELGTEKIWKLLKSYALPAIIAMTASSLYNMVDSIFVGQGVGPMAISGLAVTFPLMNLSTAFGTLVGVGGSTLLSILLGQKNYNGVRKVLSNIITLNIIIGLIFSVLSLMFLDPILYFFGASENTITYARDYMRIILIGNIITHVYFGLNNAMRATGNPKKAMSLTIFTVFFNTALDPLLIFGMNLGIKGAAWATVIAQALAMVVVILHFSRKDRNIRFEQGIIHLDRRIAKDSLEIGFGPFLMNAASCIVALFINQQMGKYAGDLGIGAYGLCNRFTFLFVMIRMGLNQGMQPIISYNYGAGNKERVLGTFKRMVTICLTVTLVMSGIAILHPQVFSGLFTNKEELLTVTNQVMPVYFLGTTLFGIQMACQTTFIALGQAKASLFIALLRKVILLIPLAMILPRFFGVMGVYYAEPVADILSVLTTIVLFTITIRKVLKNWETNETR